MNESPLELGAVSLVGTAHAENEDYCAATLGDDGVAVAVIADGVSSYPSGDVASRTAVEAMLRALREQPQGLAATKRLHRAVQRANIAVYDLAITVPELRGMATTLTSVLVDQGRLVAMHVGDCRLYLIRPREVVQLTKDHTVAAERARLGLLRKDALKSHPDRFVLTRCLGRELIAAVDQITANLAQGDVLLLCSDGLYNALDDAEVGAACRELSPADACRILVDLAKERGAIDDISAAMIRVTGPVPQGPAVGGFEGMMRRFFR